MAGPASTKRRLRRTVDGTRTALAFLVIGLGITGIVLISWLAIANSDDKAETSRLVFGSVLPLIGTWVGGVLAFYFARDNLQAGSQTAISAITAARGLDADTLVTAIMTPLNRIDPRRNVASSDDAAQIPLSDLRAAIASSGRSRVPIFAEQVVVYVVHEPDLDKYAGSRAAGPDDTVAQLLGNPDIKAELEGFTAVAPTATLSEARASLSRTLHGKDVFVTETGQRSGKVLGWLTNSDLARTD